MGYLCFLSPALLCSKPLCVTEHLCLFPSPRQAQCCVSLVQAFSWPGGGSSCNGSPWPVMRTLCPWHALQEHVQCRIIVSTLNMVTSTPRSPPWDPQLAGPTTMRQYCCYTSMHTREQGVAMIPGKTSGASLGARYTQSVHSGSHRVLIDIICYNLFL